jgi:hypothetical protein
MHGGGKDLIILNRSSPKGESVSGQADYKLHFIFVFLCAEQGCDIELAQNVLAIWGKNTCLNQYQT